MGVKENMAAAIEKIEAGKAVSIGELTGCDEKTMMELALFFIERDISPAEAVVHHAAAMTTLLAAMHFDDGLASHQLKIMTRFQETLMQMALSEIEGSKNAAADLQ
jgi:hypothetical protein